MAAGDITGRAWEVSITDMSLPLTRGVDACVVDCRGTGPHGGNCGGIGLVGKKRSAAPEHAHPGAPAKRCCLVKGPEGQTRLSVLS